MSKDASKEQPARILIVDDHELVRHGLAQLLSDEPDLETCGEAEDVDGAIKQVEETNPDLVVVDISLKNGNGLELIKRIKTNHPNVKTLVSSMHDESLFAERVLHAGAMGFINKQQAMETVIDAIRQVLAGHVYLSPDMTDRLVHGIVDGQGKPGTSPVNRLSDRELQVFEMIGQGLSTREVANQLHLSIKTIETHREHIKDKMSLKNAAELSRHAVQWVLENA